MTPSAAGPEKPPEELSLPIPAGLFEALATRAADIAIARLQVEKPPDHLTVAEAAHILRCKPQRVYELLSAGRLERHRDGSRVLISRTELYAYLSDGSKKRPASRRT